MRILVPRHDAADVEPVAVGQVTTRLTAEQNRPPRWRYNDTPCPRVGTSSAKCFRRADNWAEKKGLFAANPKPLIERTFRRSLTGLAATPRYKSDLSRKKRPQPEQKTSQSGYFGPGETVFPVRPAQFIVVPLIKPPRKLSACIFARTTFSASRRRKRHLSQMPPPAATASNQGCLDARTKNQSPNSASLKPASTVRRAVLKRRPGHRPSRPTFRPAKWPVSPFVLALVPGTTRSTPTGRDCLAADTARVRTWFAPRAIPASTQAPLPDFSV